MRAFVVGGDGLVGRNLVGGLRKAGHTVIATTRQSNTNGDRLFLDLANPINFGYGAVAGCDVMYLVAAITKVVDCEADPASTWRVNADGPVAVTMNMPLRTQAIFMSSDAVERAPNLNYSKQKAYVESFILARGGIVVRPSRIPQDKIAGLIQLLINCGNNAPMAGVFRWDP